MKKTARLLAGALLVAGGTVASAGAATATGTGDEGCTPGYWKNHTSSWEEKRPSAKVRALFTGSASLTVGSKTLLQALQGGGGSGVEGASRILARAAVAAYLNAVHDGLGYPLTRQQVVSQVNDAFASGSREKMLSVAARLDRLNNLGCPL